MKNEAVSSGDFIPLSFSGTNEIFSYKWVKGDQHILVCVNFGEGQGGGSVILDDAPLTGSTIPVKDLMTGTVYDRDPNELRTTGLIVILDGFQVQIFQY